MSIAEEMEFDGGFTSISEDGGLSGEVWYKIDKPEGYRVGRWAPNKFFTSPEEIVESAEEMRQANIAERIYNVE